jgi:hypothetical protein
MALLVRSMPGAPDLAAAIAREVRIVDPELPVHSVRTMDDWLGAAVARRRFLMRLLVTFGALATLLALVGMYGVTSRDGACRHLRRALCP